MPGRLYGIGHSNRPSDRMWGKNEFNSCFPLSLCLWMDANGLRQRVLFSGSEGRGFGFAIEEADLATIFGTDIPVSELFYSFETAFEAFKRLQKGNNKAKNADVVVAEAVLEVLKGRARISMGTQLGSFEMKLTVMPDASTAGLSEDCWAPELVIRPATTSQCAMSLLRGMAQGARQQVSEAIERFDLQRISDWTNQTEVRMHLDDILEVARTALGACAASQIPILIQPVWATKGHRSELHDDAFDVIVWTDMAIMAMIFNEALVSPDEKGNMHRSKRSMVRFVKALMDLLARGFFNYDHIYTKIEFGSQTDKELSVRGTKLVSYIPQAALSNRRVSKARIHDIVLDGGLKNLAPERRLDQSLFFLELQRQTSAAGIPDMIRDSFPWVR